MSNMYEFVKTWNPVGGECSHQCCYCYVNSIKKRNKYIDKKYSGKPQLIEKELKKNLGKNKTWFVCSMIDLFAENIPDYIIITILSKCLDYDNTYFFQSKNPKRFHRFVFPENTILCTTIESNRTYHNYRSISKAPVIRDRAFYMSPFNFKGKYKKMVTIEPILDFNLPRFVKIIRFIKPDQVNIGADSKGYNLPEPNSEKVKALISELEKFTKVYQKSNLKRLLKGV